MAPQSKPRAGKAQAEKYPPDVIATARRANELRSHQSKRIGPAQAARVLAGLRAQAEGDLTPEQVVNLSGCKSLKALKDIAAGKGTREGVAALRVPPEAAGDQYARGQWFAALAAAAAEVLKREEA
ncbi:MAG: hypothetical protein ACRDM7_10075 [Thermoleophilaceae bacterium]